MLFDILFYRTLSSLLTVVMDVRSIIVCMSLLLLPESLLTKTVSVY